MMASLLIVFREVLEAALISAKQKNNVKLSRVK